MPVWLGFVVAGLAMLGSVVALLSSVAFIGVRWQPDTGHGEDIGRIFALAALLPTLFVGTFLALGTGAAGLILGGKARRPATVALVVAAIAVGCTLAAWLA